MSLTATIIAEAFISFLFQSNTTMVNLVSRQNILFVVLVDRFSECINYMLMPPSINFNQNYGKNLKVF